MHTLLMPLAKNIKLQNRKLIVTLRSKAHWRLSLLTAMHLGLLPFTAYTGMDHEDLFCEWWCLFPLSKEHSVDTCNKTRLLVLEKSTILYLWDLAAWIFVFYPCPVRICQEEISLACILLVAFSPNDWRNFAHQAYATGFATPHTNPVQASDNYHPYLIHCSARGTCNICISPCLKQRSLLFIFLLAVSFCLLSGGRKHTPKIHFTNVHIRVILSIMNINEGII